MELSENSHQGFEGLKAAVCLAPMDAKSNNASGLQPCLRREGTGSRSSGKEQDETGFNRKNPGCLYKPGGFFLNFKLRTQNSELFYLQSSTSVPRPTPKSVTNHVVCMPPPVTITPTCPAWNVLIRVSGGSFLCDA
jgi:hypothetical protein